jgi:hypothetical protein
VFGLASYEEIKNIACNTTASFIKFGESAIFTGYCCKFIGLDVKYLRKETTGCSHFTLLVGWATAFRTLP